MRFSNEEIGLRIRSLREKQGLTRERLAEKADISVQFLADIEKGRKSMSVTTLRMLATALTVTTDTVIYGIPSDETRINPDLYALCIALDAKQQAQAAKLIRLLLESANDR